MSARLSGRTPARLRVFRSPELVRALRLHPGQPLCKAGCGWPLHPVLVIEGHATHPLCDPQLDVVRLDQQRRKARR